MSVVELPPPPPSEFERTPPQDLAAEQCVLGGMMLSKDAIADVIEALRGDDFYKPAHQLIFDAVLDLYGRGEPADAITVAAELTKRGEIARAGGAPYLHTLLSSVPTAANAGYYAHIVRERAILRRLVEAGTRITQMGYSGDGEVDAIVDSAQAEIYQVTERRASEDYQPLSAIMEGTLDEIESIGNRGGQMIGVPTGFTELDQLTNGFHPGQMIIVAARPAIGKSTVSLDFLRSAAIKHGQTSVVFSLEMSRNEITMRLLSAEAQIGLHKLRTGTLTDDDWMRLARKTGEVSQAPLFIDDSPNMTMMEIRAKARRLKQRHNLRLVVIDYMQLMTSGKKVESRQQEVSEFSRSLKLMAKELEVPVIAISQLNRGPEQRTDKKPMLSDLRESGCLPASTRVLRADTGAEVTLGELFASEARDVPVWALDDSLRYVRRHLTHVFSTGTRPVFRLRLASGKSIRATANHPFLTYDGWMPLGELVAGSRVAVPRHVPAPELEASWSDEQVVAHAQHVGASSGAAVPEEVFRLPKRQIRLFLHHLWGAGGSISLNSNGREGRVFYAATSRRLVDDVSRLLLRFGLSTRLRSARPAGGHGPEFVLDVAGAEDQKVFLSRIGVHGARGETAAALLHALAEAKTADGAAPVPGEVWDQVRSVLTEHGAAPRRAAPVVTSPVAAAARQHNAARADGLGRVAAVLDAAELELEATNDVLWDPVVAIEPDGLEPVYDATVLGAHNFIADGVAVHNSLEQDADIVILLHREDFYEKESPRAGEADLIVAKHRNGPTSTVTVAFQGHYSRFVDMQQM
jgi:replicative DNA helicase